MIEKRKKAQSLARILVITKAQIHATVVCVMMLALFSPASASATEIDSLLAQARHLFYASVEKQAHIDPAIALFKKIGALEISLQGRTQTYIGALTALRAKHAVWPSEKWRAANEGLKLMDEGLALAPQDVEALFVHGSTCYYLPIFFGRSDDAQQNLRTIARLLPEHHQYYDRTLVCNVIDFLLQNLRLHKPERNNLVALKRKLTPN